MKIRRAPAAITLVLIGTAALPGCKDEIPSQRDLYKTRADCLQDWGSDPRQCEPVRSGSTHTGFFYGPIYHGGNAAAGTVGLPRYGSHSAGTQQISRGGLGSSASSHSSGG